MKKFLIVGLGNIGADYTHTRHNIGFQILDHFAAHHQLDWQTVKLGDRAEYKVKGRAFILIKPSTYMNLSGKAVLHHLQQEKLDPSQMLVIADDLNLTFGAIRLKAKGSDGGHNGLKDIQNALQTTVYPRFRFGISNTFGQGQQVDYVLGKWSPEETKLMPERLQKSIEIIPSFGLSGLAQTMNSFNGT
jgi:peptidyl-tRNA hydrolase, PTH1 family